MIDVFMLMTRAYRLMILISCFQYGWGHCCSYWSSETAEYMDAPDKVSEVMNSSSAKNDK